MKRPLMISIEGIPCAGKSTLQEKLFKRYGGVIIQALWEYGGGPEKYSKLPKTYEEIRMREREILRLNLKMLEDATRAFKNSLSSYLHQSHISSLAFSYAYSRYSKINTLEDCAKDYLYFVEFNPSLKLPDMYIFLVISYDTFLERHKRRERFVNEIWLNQKFVEDYSKFYYEFTLKVKKVPTFYIDGEKSKEEVFLKAIEIIENFDVEENREVITNSTIFLDRFNEFIKSFETI